MCPPFPQRLQFGWVGGIRSVCNKAHYRWWNLEPSRLKVVAPMKGDLLMTTQQDIQRAGLRALMADPALGIPDYSADPKVVGRVGKIIGETAAHDERHVRASDGRVRSTDPVSADKI